MLTKIVVVCLLIALVQCDLYHQPFPLSPVGYNPSRRTDNAVMQKMYLQRLLKLSSQMGAKTYGGNKAYVAQDAGNGDNGEQAIANRQRQQQLEKISATVNNDETDNKRKAAKLLEHFMKVLRENNVKGRLVLKN